MRQFANASVSNGLCQRKGPAFFPVWHQDALVVKKVDGHFRHHNFHDAFAVAGAGDPPRLEVSITAAADEGGVADASGELAAGAPCRGACGEISMAISRDSAYRAVFVADVMFSRM